MLNELIEDLIIKGIRNIFEHLEDYSLFHPRLATAGKIAVYLLLTLGGTAWFAFHARIAWLAEKEAQMWLNLICGLLYLLLIGFVCLRRLVRWLRKREETD